MPGVRSILCLLIAAACVGFAPGMPAPRVASAAEESLAELIETYETHLVRRDEIAYEGQERTLGMIAALRSDEARSALLGLLARYASADRRRAALILGALVRYGSPKALDQAIDWVEARKDPLLVDLLHRIVAEVRLPTTRAHLRDGALRSATPRVKAQIVRALGTAGEQAAVAPLLKLVLEPHRLVRIETLIALGRLRSRLALPVVQVFLRDADAYVRDAAARGLGLLGDARALPALLRALRDPSTRVVESAAGALGVIGDPAAIPPLIQGLTRARGNDLRLEDAFTQALQAISGKAIHSDPQLWTAWWTTVKDRKPFTRAAEKPGTKTVPGPRYYGFPVRSSRIVFVLDVSRSMGWNKRLDLAQKELIQVLESLPPTTRFNLIAFSDRPIVWRRGLVDAKPARVRQAVEYVRKLQPLNGTHTYDALAKAFEDPDVDTIFFLSDGNPSGGRVTDTELILMQVRNWNRFRRVRMHCLFMLRGQPPVAFRSQEDPERAFAFMERLAGENHGRFKAVK